MQADHSQYDLTAGDIKALQDIVGEKYVNVDPCVRDTYAFFSHSDILNYEGKAWAPRPAAVVLPKTSEEIAKITQFCNTNDLMVKPISTGVGHFGAPSTSRTIMIDLKRMDNIIDIDVKNQTAVIEPYVKAVILQNALWKDGLNTQVVSCGGQHSILASVTSTWGWGLTGPSCGYSGRNMLGLEWVMPSGETITLGSAGEGAGWFSMAGPGPNLHGLIRGFSGALGGLGTYTKCAVKCTRWDGPRKLRIEGANPVYELKDDLPPHIGVFNIVFGSQEGLREGVYKLGEADIPYADFRLPAFFLAVYSTKTNLEFIPLWNTGVIQMLMTHGIQMTVVGSSQAEYDWKVKALKKIVKENGGLRLPLQDTPPFLMKALQGLFAVIGSPMEFAKKAPFVQAMIDKLPAKKAEVKKLVSLMFMLHCRHANNAQGSFRPASGMGTVMGSMDCWDVGINQNNIANALKVQFQKEGTIIDDGEDMGCGGTYEAGHIGYLETVFLYNPKNPASNEASIKFAHLAAKECIDHHYSPAIETIGEGNDEVGPKIYDYHLWMHRIKDALDPNRAADSWSYIGPSEK